MSKWIRSNNARRLFLYSSWVIVWTGFFMLFMLTPWFKEIDSIHHGRLILRALASPLAVLAPPAALVILFGMLFFCIREDDSSVGIKILWLILFFVTACFGTAIYFFSVYRKETCRIVRAG